MAYCAASDVLLYGNFATTDASPAILAALIPRAQAIIDEYTGRTFEYTNSTDGGTTRYFSPDEDVAGLTLLLDEDLASITSIKSGTITVAATQYVTEPRTDKPIYAIKLRDNSSDTWDNLSSDGHYEDSIQVKGEWVYSTTAPADIKHACIRLTYYLYKQRETDADLDRPLLTADGVTIMPTRLPADVTSILNRYRRVRVA